MSIQPDTISHATLKDEHGNRFSVNIVVGSCFVSVLNPGSHFGVVLDLFDGMLRGEIWAGSDTEPLDVIDIKYLPDDEEEESDDE